ncbi:tetratricopeptide (TPR) repeat protein [Acidovorax soli]|jgi:tetratricopeptide (TPR) repeat protein|uniref:Tetratricopeptide (TPR) repeat protein n=1 Tax=Acidovorax soli TaxID=592050 RepID=A0A7X0UD61_9BURK|nr:tetratricopeptide repeat protein [Acidovorax soli]MBB6563729.1 tetratricopeptide (TPR) repeat protein [Acidovorax soli]
MIDQARASRLASQAFDLWQSGKGAEAIPLYEQSLTLADPSHYRLPDYHGELATVLSELGRFPQARNQLELSLSVTLGQGAAEGSIGVVIARYFLADHLLGQQRPQEALQVIEPSLAKGIASEWLLRLVKATALHALGRIDEARPEAAMVLETAPSSQKREELAELLGKLQLP